MDSETFKLLQKQDWDTIGKRLVNYARWKAFNYIWRRGGDWELAAGKTVEDIVQDIIVKTIEGRRKWCRDRVPSLEFWLKRQIDSDIYHLYNSAAHLHEVPFPESQEGEELTDKIESVSQREYVNIYPRNPEDIVLKKEEIEHRENMLLQAASEDLEIEELLEAFINADEPKRRYVADILDVPTTDVTNRIKRLRRRIAKMTKGESS